MGVAKVLSTISGTPALWATRANFSISKISKLGLEMVSPKIALVLGRMAAASSSSVALGDTKVKSMPSLRRVTLNRL